MGAGDLNFKKSWHPMLHSNQEKVWLQEQEAIKERKRLEELRKEREYERQMQELQRIHEEAGGKKRVERVEWMYATPAVKGGPSEGELEDYLLGKKRVDKLLQGNEAEQLSRNAELGSSDNKETTSQRDMASKIREDPLLAIKQQEQAVYDMLMKDPTRFRQMRAKMGLPADRSELRHRRRDRESERGSRHYSSSHHDPRERSERRYDDRRSHDYDRRQRSYDRYHDGDRRSRGYYSKDCRSESHYYHDRRSKDYEEEDRRSERRRYDERSDRYHDRDARNARRPDDARHRGYDQYVREEYRDRDSSVREPTYTPRDRNGAREYPPHSRTSRRRSRSPPRDEASREARLATMMADAKKMDDDRNARIEKINAEERKAQTEDEQRRNDAYDQSKWSQGGGTGKAAFLMEQQRNLWGGQSGVMDLHERLKRNRQGLERLADD